MWDQILGNIVSSALNGPVKDKIVEQFPNLANTVVDKAGKVISSLGGEAVGNIAKGAVNLVDEFFYETGK